MHINEGYIVGLHPLYPSGTNSTMFTLCCNVAICDDEPNCPVCKRKVIGWDAESSHKTSKIRWRHAYVKPQPKEQT